MKKKGTGQRRHYLEFAWLAAVMTTIAGVAWPIGQRVSLERDRRACLDNLRKIGEGIREWSRLNDYALPPGRGMSGFCDSPGGDPMPGALYAVEPGLNALWDKGHGVIRDVSVFRCPGDKQLEPPPAVGEDFTSPRQVSYGMTGHLYPTDPANKVVVADKSDKNLADGTMQASPNHGHQYINVLFFDGSVATFAKPVLPPGRGSDTGSIYIRETGAAEDTYIE